MMRKANLWLLLGLLALALATPVQAETKTKKPATRKAKTTVLVVNKKKSKTTVLVINGNKKKQAAKKPAKRKTTVLVINGNKKKTTTVIVGNKPAKRKTTVLVINGNQNKQPAKRKTTVMVINGNNKPAKRTSVVVIGGNNNKPAQTAGPVICTQRICALYGTTAKGKVSWKCGLKKYRGNCSCVKTDTSCGKNWRGKIKYYFQCSCRPICKQTICARYSLVAKTKSSVKCGWKKGYSVKGCSCVQGNVCAKNWRGANKYNFQCACK